MCMHISFCMLLAWISFLLSYSTITVVLLLVHEWFTLGMNLPTYLKFIITILIPFVYL